MTVYIEYVLINNFVIDFLLLKAAFSITGKRVSTRRLLLCAFFGALAALGFPLLGEGALAIVVKVLFGALIIAAAARYKSKKDFYVNACVFFAVTFLTGGAVTAFFSLFNVDETAEYVTAIMIFPVYFTLKFAKAIALYARKRKNTADYTVAAEFSLPFKKARLTAFLDSGNLTYDNGSPVVFLDKKLVREIVPVQSFAKVRTVRVNTVAGEGVFSGIKADGLKIYYKQGNKVFNDVTVCFADTGAEYDVILHGSFLEDCDLENTCKIKKIS